MTRHKAMRLVALTLVVLTIVWRGASPVFAAAPSNDDFDSATVITALPFHDSIDTTEATAASDDPYCYGDIATVWYKFTPTQDMRIEADTFGSSYDTTLSVYTGSRGSLTQITCGDQTNGSDQAQVSFDAIAGQTYYFMVSGFDNIGGGQLVFNVQQAPPPLQFTNLTIDRTGSVNPQTGVATISGSVTCSQSVPVNMSGTLTQQFTRLTASGTYYTSFQCSGTTHWTATVTSSLPITFGPGRAVASADAQTYDSATSQYLSLHASSNVTLRGR